MSEVWFPGDVLADDRAALLAEVRREAAARDLAGVRPADTRALDRPDELVLVVRPPGLEDVPGRPEAQVGIAPHEEPPLLVLVAWETHGFVLDPPVPLEPPATGGTPGALAGAALDWLGAQLHRPVERCEWDAWHGRPRRLWRFADDGEVLARTWGTRWRARRRPPDRVVRLR